MLYSLSFTGNGLNWCILIMEPLEVQSDDTIMPGDSTLAVIITPAILGALACTIFFALLWKYRKERDVIYSDWRFTNLFIFGCILLNLSCLSFIGENSDELCILREWLLYFFFVFALAPLIVKVYQMYLLVGQSGIP